MVQSRKEAYVQAAKLVPVNKPIKLLDLGCCTELEYDAFIRVNPEIEVTGILEEACLNELLKKKAGKRIERLRLIYGNFMEVDLGKRRYDAAISVMEFCDRKSCLSFYHKVYASLEEDGIYIERNCVKEDGQFIGSDSRFSNQVSLLLESGFQRVEKVWHGSGTIILKAMK